jgi:hypothetical protein
MEKWKNIFSDREFWFILLFNLYLAMGFQRNWLSMDTIVWIYFFQSIIIGLSNTVRMICLKKFTTENFTINDQAVAPTNKTKWTSALFFLFHFGFFHLVYFVFLIINTLHNGSKLDLNLVFINIAIMFVNAIISTWSIIIQDKEEKPNISGMFFTPYLRVVPMHIFIIIGFTNKLNLNVVLPIVGAIHIFWVFLILKLVSDLIMHILIFKTWQNQRPKAIGGFI